jgi:hypothetical protein
VVFRNCPQGRIETGVMEMTISAIGMTRSRPARQHHDAVYWLGLAASPTFSLMAWLSSIDPAQNMVCSPASGVLPLDGMTSMYLLMSLFHLPPWLKIASAHLRQSTRPTSNSEGN